MKNITAKLILLTAISIPVVATAGDVIKKASAHSVQETMDSFVTLIKSKGMRVFARIDHKENAAGVNLKMNDSQVLIFGNPKGGTVLMQKDPTVSLELPLRVAVYKDDDGKVWLSYHNPQSLKDSYNVSAAAQVLNKVEGGLDKLTSAATK